MNPALALAECGHDSAPDKEWLEPVMFGRSPRFSPPFIGGWGDWATLERVVSEIFDAGGEADAGQARAAGERHAADCRDAVGDDDAGQARAARERVALDSRDAIGDDDVGQAGATRETMVTDYPDASGNDVEGVDVRARVFVAPMK